MWLNDLFWGIRNTFVEKYHFLVINDHLWGPSVHVDKSFKKIQARVRPPSPPSRQCQDFGNLWFGIPSLRSSLYEQLHIFKSFLCLSYCPFFAFVLSKIITSKDQCTVNAENIVSVRVLFQLINDRNMISTWAWAFKLTFCTVFFKNIFNKNNKKESSNQTNYF